MLYLTWRRAAPAGEFWEVVGAEQPLEGLLPLVPEDQVIPGRDDVTQGAASVGLAERGATVHAPGMGGGGGGREALTRFEQKY